MKEFIAYLVKNLVDHPDEVDIRCMDQDSIALVEIRVAKKDIGKVIGRKGMTINALRTIVMTVCSRLGKRVRVELIEPEEEEAQTPATLMESNT